jgi:hypothetical protein
MRRRNVEYAKVRGALRARNGEQIRARSEIVMFLLIRSSSLVSVTVWPLSAGSKSIVSPWFARLIA